MKTYSKILKRASRQVKHFSSIPRALLALLFLFSGPAYGYVCSQSDYSSVLQAAPSLSLPTRQLVFTLNARGASQLENEYDAIAQSMNAWEFAQGCTAPNKRTDIDLELSGQRSENTAIGYNYLPEASNENLIIFHDNHWPHPATRSFQYALTTVTSVPLTGEILDTDIELNSNHKNFSVNPGPSEADLLSIIIHELGHALGLGHSQISEATMAAGYKTGSTHQRTLHCDDHNGVSFKYPQSEPNGYCSREDPNCPNCFGPLPQLNTLVVQASPTSATTGCQCRSNNLPLVFLLLVGRIIPQIFGRLRRLYRS